LILIAAVGAAGCGRHHTLQDGPYQFHLASVIRDDCSLASKPNVFAQADLRTTGHVVAMDYGLFDIQLVGNYLASDFTGIERMRLDGSAANVNTTITGVECLLDQAVFHVDSTTTGPGSFEGTFSIDLDSRRRNECVCQFWFNYTASSI
jgi:hypothetical protein